MDAESALEELSTYMNEMLKFCKKKGLHQDIRVKYSFMMRYLPRGVYTQEFIENLDQYSDFWDYVILEHDFGGENVREMFVKEHTDLPESIKKELLNMKSIRDFFIVEKIDREKNEIILRKIYSEERYHVWTKALLTQIRKGELLEVRLIFWRGYVFAWGGGRRYEQKVAKVILTHENFLRELEKDIKSFISLERQSLSHKTVRRREACLWTFYDFVYKNPEVNSYRRFNKTLVKKYIKWLNSMIGISRSFIKDSLTSIRKFFDYLVRNRKIPNNPAKEVIVP